MALPLGAVHFAGNAEAKQPFSFWQQAGQHSEPTHTGGGAPLRNKRKRDMDTAMNEDGDVPQEPKRARTIPKPVLGVAASAAAPNSNIQATGRAGHGVKRTRADVESTTDSSSGWSGLHAEAPRSKRERKCMISDAAAPRPAQGGEAKAPAAALETEDDYDEVLTTPGAGASLGLFPTGTTLTGRAEKSGAQQQRQQQELILYRSPPTLFPVSGRPLRLTEPFQAAIETRVPRYLLGPPGPDSGSVLGVQGETDEFAHDRDAYDDLFTRRAGPIADLLATDRKDRSSDRRLPQTAIVPYANHVPEQRLFSDRHTSDAPLQPRLVAEADSGTGLAGSLRSHSDEDMLPFLASGGPQAGPRPRPPLHPNSPSQYNGGHQPGFGSAPSVSTASSTGSFHPASFHAFVSGGSESSLSPSMSANSSVTGMSADMDTD